MKVIARFVALLAFFAAPAAWAGSPGYSGLYVFGDSLVDAGNAYLGTMGSEASPNDGYYLGRFSNGPNFADYLSLMITGKPTVPVLLGGRNVAVGGATLLLENGEQSPSFLAQVKYYADNVKVPIDPNALVLLTFGGNDVRETINTAGPIDFSPALYDMGQGISYLYALGARHFVITGSPDIGLLPISVFEAGAVPGRLAELSQRSQQISTALNGIAGTINAQGDASASFFDLLGFEHDLLAHPANYGLSPTLNTTVPCQVPGGGPAQTGCGNSLYFDPIHPTTQVHQVIATAIANQLGISPVPEGETWLLLILGMGGVGAVLRRRRAAVPAIG